MQPAQGALLPHWHWPALEQLSAMVGSQPVHDAPGAPHAVTESVVHAWPEQHPTGHDVASHTQLPPEQR